MIGRQRPTWLFVWSPLCTGYYCTALLHYSISTLCTTAQLHYSTTALLHYSTTALLFYALHHKCTTALQHYRAMHYIISTSKLHYTLQSTLHYRALYTTTAQPCTLHQYCTLLMPSTSMLHCNYAFHNNTGLDCILLCIGS